MVRINRVYTKAGDQGQTSLIGGERVSKASLRIECYGTVDELNAVLGLVRTALDGSPAEAELLPMVQRIQNELFNLGALLATPEAERRARMPAVSERHIEVLEQHMDRLNHDLPALQSFVLPGGGWSSAYLHQARTVCRRAERLVVHLAQTEDSDAVEPLAITYLNRLSDALFVAGRWAVHKEKRSEPLWQPEST